MAARGGARRGSARRAKRPDAFERAADELYGLPLDEFVTRRKELAKELRGAGDRDAASAVAGLRKPTVAAWTVNQLARRRELDVRRLLKAGESLGRRAKDAEQFRDARLEEGEVVRRLVGEGRELLESEGRPASDATLAGVADLLRSAAVDDAGRELLAAGRLTGELEGADTFELLSAALPKAAPRRRETKKPEPAAARKANREAEKLRREVEKAERRVAAAEQELHKAQEQLDRLRARADTAEDPK